MIEVAGGIIQCCHDVMSDVMRWLATVRTQIQLTEKQASELKRMAAERGVSVAELVSEGVNRIIAVSREMSPEERRRRALAVVGRYRGPGDLPDRHDDHCVESDADGKAPA